VALMSVRPGSPLRRPGQKKWVVNTMFMTFAALPPCLSSGCCGVQHGFRLSLVPQWQLCQLQMDRGDLSELFNNFVVNRHDVERLLPGETGTIRRSTRACRRLHTQASVIYFQFVFRHHALLFLGSVLGASSSRSGSFSCPCGHICYAVNAFLLWAALLGASGAGDFSAATSSTWRRYSGFVRRPWSVPAEKDRKGLPHSLPLVAIGGGIVWLAGTASTVETLLRQRRRRHCVINTNMATVAALLTWVILDMYLSKAKKPTFLGAINGMVVGWWRSRQCRLRQRRRSIGVGAIDSCIVWLAWNYLSRVNFMKKVDDAMVSSTPRHSRLFGGLLLGCSPTRQWSSTGAWRVSDIPQGAIYGHQARSASSWGGSHRHNLDGLVTFVILTVMKALMPSHSLKYADDILEIGDLAIHDEEGYPTTGATRVLPDILSQLCTAQPATVAGGSA